MFIDEATIYVRSGRGGAGMMHSIARSMCRAVVLMGETAEKVAM